MEKGLTGWLALGVWLASAVAAMTPGVISAEETSFQELDIEIEEVLNEVVSLGAEMAILEEARELSANNQLLVLVSMDPSPFFKLEAIQLKIDDRTASYHQYTDDDLGAMVKGGSQKLFWDDVPPGTHQVSLALFGRVPGDPDFQRETTQMISTGSGRKVLELRVSSGKSQAFPEIDLREWK